MNIPAWLLKVLAGAAIGFVVFFMMQVPWDQLILTGLQLFAVVGAVGAAMGLVSQGTLEAFNLSLTRAAAWAGDAIKERVQALRASNAAPVPAPVPAAEPAPELAAT